MIVAMNGTATALGDYRPVGGALCLDFANTVDWHDSDHPVELLSNAGSLSAWTRIAGPGGVEVGGVGAGGVEADRSEEHPSELQSLMRISYGVFCLKKKNRQCEYVPTMTE